MGQNAQRLPLAPILALVTSLLHPVWAGATVAATSDTLDQYQTATTTGSWPIGGGYYTQMAQIVTAGQYGFLDRVSVFLENVGASGPVAVTIQTAIGGIPSGTNIGYGTIPVNTLPSYGNPQWVSAKISGSISLAMIPGAQYAIVLSSESGTVRWYTSPNVYSRGYMLVNGQGSGWRSWSPEDARFQAYVIPDTLDQSQSHTELGVPVQLGSTPVGQTFTAGVYGILDRVSVYLVNSSINSAPITVSLRTVTSGGLPTARQIASGTIPVDAMPKPGYSGWAAAKIDPLVVTPGAKYALLLSTSAFGPGWVLAGDVYPGGTFVVRIGTNWITDPSDATFQTHVIPPILDQRQDTYDWPAGISPECEASGAVPCLYTQHFVPSWSGILPQVSVALALPGEGSAPSTATVLVAILDASGRVIGSGTIPVSKLGIGVPHWYDADIHGVDTSSVQVTAGAEYGIRLLVSAGWIWWYADTSFGIKWTYKEYTLPLTPITSGPPPPPSPVITPCANGVCPEASGRLTPADLTDGVTSHFQFRERPNGTVQGILTFTDPSPDGIKLQGCATEPAACGLTVTTFACSDTHAATISGTYTSRGGTPTRYELTLNGVSHGPGTFTLTAGDYKYTLTQYGIVDVICPRRDLSAGCGSCSRATLIEGAGNRAPRALCFRLESCAGENTAAPELISIRPSKGAHCARQLAREPHADLAPGEATPSS